MPSSPISILRQPNGDIAVIVGTQEKIEQALSLPVETWWQVMAEITKPAQPLKADPK